MILHYFYYLVPGKRQGKRWCISSSPWSLERPQLTCLMTCSCYPKSVSQEAAETEMLPLYLSFHVLTKPPPLLSEPQHLSWEAFLRSPFGLPSTEEEATQKPAWPRNILTIFIKTATFALTFHCSCDWRGDFWEAGNQAA